MPKAIEYVHNIILDGVDPDGTSHWSVHATVSDAVVTVPATYHPADSAHPEELGPAECRSVFQLEPDETPPPISGTQHDRVQFIDALDLDWEVEQND